FALRPETHCHSVRAGLGASVTYLIREANLASSAGRVVIQTIVRRCRDHNPITVDVNVGRGRPPPFQTRCIYSGYLFPLASELNRSRRRRRSRSWRAAAYSGQDIDATPSINVVWRSGSATLGGRDVNSRVIQGRPAWVDLILQARIGRPKQSHGTRDMRSCHGRAVGKRISVIGGITRGTRASARSSDIRFCPAASIDSSRTAATKESNGIGAGV